ncbi:MAG: hypothetical protein WBA51_03025 [Erythrobacter sp.]
MVGLSPAPVQIADFTALMALGQVKEGESESVPAPSIRTLFARERTDVEPSLTSWYLALLTSLYTVRGNLRASQQRYAMARTFEKVLIENP